MTSTMDPAESPLCRALPTTNIGALPVEIWVAIANGLSEDGSRYTAADAERFARKHPKLVQQWETGADARYSRPGSLHGNYRDGDLSSAWPDRRGHEDDIALELVALWSQPPEDYLQEHLAEHCAEGRGRGIEMLRTRSAEPGVRNQLAQALVERTRHVPIGERTGLLREAITIFTALGDLVAAARTRGALADHLQNTGDLQAAVRELQFLVAEYAGSAAKNAARKSDHEDALARTAYKLGRVYDQLGRRRDAREATKLAISQFTLLIRENPYYDTDLAMARWQLSRFRWYRR